MKIATVIVLLCLAYNTDGRLVGGYSKVDVKDNIITKLAQKSINAIETHNRELLKDDRILKLVNVESARVQFISGLQYILVLHVQQAGCQDCEILNCSVRVSIDTASHGKETVSVNKCKPLPTLQIPALYVKPLGEAPSNYSGEHNPLGGFEWENPEDRHVVSAARFAVSSINKMSNSMYSKVYLKVTNAKKQVVAGLNYNLTIVIGMSSCRNTAENVDATVEKCGLKQNDMETCHVTVWDRIWENPRYILNGFSCSPFGSNNAKPCDRELFNKFKDTYGRLYETQGEEDHRFTVFCANMVKAKYLQDLDQGTARYGATKFADITEEEFMKHQSAPWDLKGNDGMKEAHIPEINVPSNFDWRTKGAVTAVKNQGSCGSCWAFSTTGNIEGQWFIKNKKLFSLSEQELVDCDKVDHGCEGGLPSNAYNAIIKLGGLDTESEYPYAGSDDKCVFNKTGAVVKVNGSVKISKDEKEMATWLVQNGPISIGINAFAMQFYFGGIAHPWHMFCNPAHLDHGVLIVGFGVKGSEPYWIIKNSWGANWGVQGYYLIYRGDGSCGLNMMCTSAVV